MEKRELICPSCGGTYIVQVREIIPHGPRDPKDFEHKDGEPIISGSLVDCDSCEAMLNFVHVLNYNGIYLGY